MEVRGNVSAARGLTANILLENGVERVKITDFGRARLHDALFEKQLPATKTCSRVAYPSVREFRGLSATS